MPCSFVKTFLSFAGAGCRKSSTGDNCPNLSVPARRYIKGSPFSRAALPVWKLVMDSAAAFNNRGLVFSNTRQYGKALEDFNRAVELNPANSSAYYNRGVVYREKGMFREAAADMERYCALVPADTAAKRELEKMREKAR